MQCQYWDSFSFLLFAFYTLPGNTDSHFTHDLTLWLRIAGAVQLGFSLTGDMLQLGNREVRVARAHKTKTQKEHRGFVFLPPFRIAEQGESLAQVFSGLRHVFCAHDIKLDRKFMYRNSPSRLNRTFPQKVLHPYESSSQKPCRLGKTSSAD